MAISDFISNFFCSRQNALIATMNEEESAYSQQVATLENETTTLKNQLASAQAQAASCQANMTADTSALQTQINALTAQLATANQNLASTNSALASAIQTKNTDIYSLLPATEIAAVEAYWAQFTEADVTYTARYIGDATDPIALDVKIWGLEGQNDNAIVQLVKNARGYVTDVIHDHPELTLHQCIDIAIIRVASAINKPYLMDDSPQIRWAVQEFWMFASEMNMALGGVCHDMAPYRYVAFRIAGIPEKLLRITVGLAFNGQGHSTNYYFASDLKWHMVNSTSGFVTSNNVLNTPLASEVPQVNGAGVDQLLISYAWFHFRESFTYHGPTSAEELDAIQDKKAEIKKLPLFKNIVIKTKVNP